MILVAYASRYGSTREVAEAIAATLRRHGLLAEVKAAEEVQNLDGYGGVVLGGGIYIGRWHGDARAFVKRFKRELAELPSAVFALGPIDQQPRHWADTEKVFRGTLAKLPVEPIETRLFGGAVEPGRLPFPLNHMPAADLRDWDVVREWADELAGLFQPELASAPA
jgi:menaquinone-dependent protoporphyrinogen oxidase